MKEANKIANIIIKAFKGGNKLLICGCGGSAAQAQHMAAELICKYKYNRVALPAIALTTDTSILTALSNDFSFDIVFYRQVEALGKPGDVLMTISTSGESPSNLLAYRRSWMNCMEYIDLPRKGKDTPAIQEFQLKLIHHICEKVERAFL